MCNTVGAVTPPDALKSLELRPLNRGGRVHSIGSVAKELGLRDSVLRRRVEQRGARLEPTATTRRAPHNAGDAAVGGPRGRDRAFTRRHSAIGFISPIEMELRGDNANTRRRTIMRPYSVHLLGI